MAAVLPAIAEATVIGAETLAAKGAQEGAKQAFRKGIGQGLKEGGERLMSKVLPTVRRVGESVKNKFPYGSKTPFINTARNFGKVVARNEAKTFAKAAEKTGAQSVAKAAEKGGEVAKESFKKKAFDAIVVGGILPGVGFTVAGNMLSQPSSAQNPNITNGDLVKAHSRARGNHSALMNHQFDNGKTFKQVQSDFYKANKAKLHKAKNNQKMLYTKTGKPTKLNVSAKLHGIDLGK
jgi:hypothetical protein